MGLGNLSGTSRRFMLIDAEIKATEQMEIFGFHIICIGRIFNNRLFTIELRSSFKVLEFFRQILWENTTKLYLNVVVI